MKRLIFLLFSAVTVCFPDEKPASSSALFYEVAPNTNRCPFPTKIPAFRKRDPKRFDWKKYIAEATSEADRAYRALFAYPHYYTEIPGGNSSNSGDWTRFRLAATEMAEKCSKIEALYRERLKNNAPTLGLLNKFIATRHESMAAEIELIGGSWDGSGTKTAYASAELAAYVDYFHALKGLQASLHFQDMPNMPE